MKTFHLIKYEFKFGLFFLVIFLLGLVSVILNITSIINLYEFKLFNQGFVIPVFGIWIVSIYKEFYEGELKELLFCYPLSSSDLGIKKVLTLMFLSFVLISPLTLVDENMSLSLILYLTQTSFFISLGFLLISVTRNFEIAVTFILIYVSTEFLTKGNFVPWPHIMVFDALDLEQINHLINKAVIAILYSLICLYFGQLFLSINKRE